MAGQFEYNNTMIPTLDEVLETDDKQAESVKKEITDTFGVDGFIENLRTSAQMLMKVEMSLEQILISYENNTEDREPIEKAYALEISILQNMARQFHPLSDYGKEMLQRAAKSRGEFESIVGPMITNITQDNIDLFRTVLSRDIAEDIINKRLYALGALRTSKETTYGVGAIVYHVDSLFPDAEEALRIDWLFVNKKFRERGVAHHLIGELIYQMSSIGMADMSVEIPANIKDKQLMCYIFGSWQFLLDTEIDSDTVIRLGDMNASMIKTAGKEKVRSFASFDKATARMIVKKALRLFAYKGSLWNIPVGYVDRELSFFVGEGADIKLLLLSHRMPSGIIRVECPGAAPEAERYLPDLLGAFFDKVTENENDDTIIMFSSDAEELGGMISDVCPDQLGRYVISGTLTTPAQSINLNHNDIDELLKEAE